MRPSPSPGTVDVLGLGMYYRESGSGPPVVLIHGNPTSGFLWRHVLDRAAGGHRWIAPDLIGMGASARPQQVLTLADHVRYVEAFLDALGLHRTVLVGHDWGVAIAFELLRRRPQLVRGVAFMEGHLRPLDRWDDLDEGGRDLFRRLRTPGVGERMVLEENFFLETLLPAALVRPLSDEDLATYRAPYPDPASRRALLQWAREIPVEGHPEETARLMAAATDHLTSSSVPTLLLHGSPGVLVTGTAVAWCRANLRALQVVDVGGPAGHFLPEDRPVQVADALVRWVQELP